MMAGDKQFSHSGGVTFTGKTKIYEIPTEAAQAIFNNKRCFVGFAGNADSFADAIGFFYAPTDKHPKLRGVEMLMLNEKGQIFHGTSLRNWLQISEPFFAIGSGMQYAISAMASGKDPFEAVKIASKYDASTGRGFNKLVMT